MSSINNEGGNRDPLVVSYNFTSSSAVWSQMLSYGDGATYMQSSAYDGESTIYSIVSYNNDTYTSFYSIDVNSGPTTDHM